MSDMDDGDDGYTDDPWQDMNLMYGDEKRAKATIQGWICRHCEGWAGTLDGVAFHVDARITDHAPQLE